ncbi:hypothetical protein BGZ60DRAFT_432852 [Tricladium varicosporioides]|nr:hypothetical protein BGZ60DRAFT_432852 [Hymenoscyphus varicosporioides]
MDHKYVRYTNPALGQEDLRPARKRKRGSDWEMMKADIYRIYMDEDNDLKTTKTMISLIPGFESFNACDRTWKEQLDAWHFVKKVKHEDMEIMIAKEQQRASEGKSTEFTYWQRRVEPEKLERAKKRGNARELSPSVGMFTYSQPLVICC